MKYFPLVWAGLWRRRTRTLLTALSIVVAFLLFGLLQGVNAAFSRGVDLANVDRLVVINRIALTEPLPYAQLGQIRNVEGVRSATHATWFGGYYQEPRNFVFAVPVEIDSYLETIPEIEVPPEAVEAFKQSRTAAIVGGEALRRFGWKIGDRVPLQSQIWPQGSIGNLEWTFDIVGVFETPNDPNQSMALMFRYDYFDEARLYGNGTVGWYIVRVADPERAAPVAEAIDALFMNSPNETRTQSEKAFAQSFIKQFGDINFIANSIIGAVFFALLFLTGNTLMQSLRERIPEFAVLKTLGWTDRGVLALVLAEAVLLCTLSALVGLALAWLAFPALKDVLGAAQLPLTVILSGVGVSLVLALVIGLPPALRGQRLQIVDALSGR